MSERTVEDQVLISRAQNGDRGAFDDLVARYQVKAFAFAFRLTRNEEEAGDVVAEAFVRVYNALGTFKAHSSFSTWFYRILTNCFLDIYKKAHNRQTVSIESGGGDDGELERQIEDPGPTPERSTMISERDRAVAEAIGQLPEYQRAMIVMYHAEMMSYEEIAAALDLPLGTVKSRLNRARLLLRDLLLKNEELFHS